jgi:hypothetical protein
MLVCEDSLWSYGAVKSNNHQGRSGWGVIDGIRVDHRGFKGTYGPIEKDTVAYKSGTWVHMHDAWILWEGHGMVCMVLTGHTICVWTWPSGGIFGLGLTNGDISLLRGVNCDMFNLRFNKIDRILIPPRYTFFSESPSAKNSRVKCDVPPLSKDG